ncbi:hypothetical protein HDF22_004929 [Mucilaginibacter lappiensis]|uniref:Uncharacterized protein n=1 Tax=Mucilaginibacter lappiensis TaxID=354630 RepID=A0A841JJX7_9SPHI|nr:hypothetical protein [Mucilaginibacter lappiensis]
MLLHINIEDLLNTHSVESEGHEFKERGNPDVIYRSICVFANDFENVDGDYIIIHKHLLLHKMAAYNSLISINVQNPIILPYVRYLFPLICPY